MRKLAVALALFLGVGAAGAQTITLFPSPCTGVRVCSDVANSSGDPIAIYAQLQRKPVVVIDGVAYTGTAFDSGSLSITQTASAPDGSQITFTVNFNHSVHVVNSGRAHYYIQFWSVKDGTVTINGGSSAVAPLGVREKFER